MIKAPMALGRQKAISRLMRSVFGVWILVILVAVSHARAEGVSFWTFDFSNLNEGETVRIFGKSDSGGTYHLDGRAERLKGRSRGILDSDIVFYATVKGPGGSYAFERVPLRGLYTWNDFVEDLNASNQGLPEGADIAVLWSKPKETHLLKLQNYKIRFAEHRSEKTLATFSNVTVTQP